MSDHPTSGDYRFIIAIAFVVATFFVYWYALATRDPSLIDSVRNTLVPIITMIVGFYFGSKNKG